MPGLVMSHLDYCNNISVDLPEASIKCMQNVENIESKVILKARKYDSLKQCLFNLHWLPI